MPASSADPVSSVLKNAFASNGGRTEISGMHQPTGLIRGGSSSSIASSGGSLSHEPATYKMNGLGKISNSISSLNNSSLTNSPNLENGIRANAKKALLSSQQCDVEFDAPTRSVGSASFGQNNATSSNSKLRYIILNPQQKQVRNYTIL